ncbi:hypothetical protein B296_00050788 [Ensete ventricosum]|uniref:Uncharacterized protein n=1 Tax=Ensete ventricosum TaxID=4639 RepID=A0A426YDU1_ENSVE|nr:hypothetical protein B296_00050788 [Ensete ventricosum]
MKLSSNSFTSESKEEMDDGLSRLYHIRAEPLRVVGKARHIRESEVAPFELMVVGAFLAVVLTEGRPTVEMPTSASTGECAGQWSASSQSMLGPGG